MIVVKLQGGLGNQMFQYAFGRSISLDTGIPLGMDNIELEGGEGITRRRYSLGVFNIEERILSKKEFRYFTFGKKHPVLIKIKKLLGLKVPNIVRQAGDFSFLDALPYIDTEAKEIGIYFDGNFQSERYFLKHSEIIKNDFTLKVPLGNEAKEVINHIRSTESVIVQVRRGDFVSNPKSRFTHGSVPDNYYSSGIDYVHKKINRNIDIFVVSDDIEWCRSNLKFPYTTHYVSRPEIKDYEEIQIMSNAKHLVISHSTFGWWGAWLNTNKEKIIVAPKKFFLNPKFKQDDVTPPSWIRI
jgi:hypothetical protein